MLVMIDWSWCGVMAGQINSVRGLRALRGVVVVLVVRLVGRLVIVSVLWMIVVVVIWLLRIAEPWSVAQGARFEYLRDGFFYEVTIRLRICWICWFIIILVLVTRFLFCIVIILIFIIIIVFTGRITKSIAVTRVVLHTPVHISPS